MRLEIVIPPSREALLEYLATGKGDLIAAGMTRTPEREKSFAFSAPYQFVSELLIVPAKGVGNGGHVRSASERGAASRGNGDFHGGGGRR